LKNQTKELGIDNKYLCPEENFKITLLGSFSGKFANILEVSVDYCDQGLLDAKYPGKKKKCKTK
jgi:hypothetical protein